VPVIVTRNRHTIPQERFNTDLVKSHGLGLVVHHWSEIPDAVARLRADPPNARRSAAGSPRCPPIAPSTKCWRSWRARRGSLHHGPDWLGMVR